MSKAKPSRKNPKPLLVESAEIILQWTATSSMRANSVALQLSNGETLQVSACDLPCFYEQGLKRFHAEDAGRRPPRGKFAREWKLLEAAAIEDENTQILNTACALLRADEALDIAAALHELHK